MRKLSFFACVALSCCALKADDVTNLGQINVISSTGNENIDASKISVRNANLIKDILRDVPGVYVGGENGLNQKIYMRGINDRGINITIDGARQKGNAFHHSADLLLDPELIKAVDIGLGVHSVVGTSGALGGSIAFETANARDLLEDGQSFGGKLKGSYTSNNKNWGQNLILFGAYEGFDALTSISHHGHDFGKSANGYRMGGDGDDLDLLFKIGYDFNDYARLELSSQRMQYDGMYPLKAEWASQGNPVDTKYFRDTYTSKFTYNPNDYVDLSANAYYTDHHMKSSLNAGVKTIGAKIINKTLFQGDTFSHTLVYGSEYYQSKSYNKNASNYTFPSKSTLNITRPGYTQESIKNPKVQDDKADSFSLFIEDQFRYGNLTLTPGIRLDHYVLHTMGGDVIGTITSPGRNGKLTTSPLSSGERAKYSWSEISPAFSIDYQLDMGLGLYASYARLFRGPDPIESIRLDGSNVLSITTNDELEPETGNAYELGIRYQTNITDNQNISLSAKYFYDQYKNLIVEMGRAGEVGIRRINGGPADTNGVEISARYNINALSLAASYSHSRTKYKNSNNNAGYGGVLAYSDSGDKYTFNAEYFIASLDTLIGYNLIAVNKIDTKNGSNTSFKKPGYATSDIYANWAPSDGKLKNLEVNFGIYNLFDKAYWSHSQRSASADRDSSIDWSEGRSIKASLSYKF